MQEYENIDDLLRSANDSALDAQAALTNRHLLINDISSVSVKQNLNLTSLNISIKNLQVQLKRALQAAASVSMI